MTVAFVDTQYFVAIFQANDQWHQNAAALELRIDDYNFVTTDTVLVEVLTIFAPLDRTSEGKHRHLLRMSCPTRVLR